MDFERVEQTGDVVGHVGDGVRVIGSGAATGVAVVEQDDLELGGELRDLLQGPQRRVVSDPHDQHEWGAVAVDLVVELLPVGADGSRSRDVLAVGGHRFVG